MAQHNTQCPHCFITYIISDEQLRVSQGMVRCGTCRERFQAEIIEESAPPRFDPREAFIEPLSDETDEQKIAAALALANAEPEEYTLDDPHTESRSIGSLNDATVTGSINSDLSIDIDENAPVTPYDSRQLTAEKMLANIRAKQKREDEQKKRKQAKNQESSEQLSLPVENVQIEEESKPSDIEAEEESIDIPDDIEAFLSKPINADSKSEQTIVDDNLDEEQATIEPGSDNESLIDEVDTLIDDKLINTKESVQLNEPFSLDQTAKVKSRFIWLYAPLLLLLVGSLSSSLFYQLWIKQLVVIQEGSAIEKKFIQFSQPVAQLLVKQDIQLPVRRNLNQLKLTSAVTEAHPTRASTILLRISVLNRAEFEQPLPWLEMTLTDSEGKLVSRRKLSPSDYIYQNRTTESIGARELKKITIELLSFPKQASGYQLKILNM